MGHLRDGSSFFPKIQAIRDGGPSKPLFNFSFSAFQLFSFFPKIRVIRNPWLSPFLSVPLWFKTSNDVPLAHTFPAPELVQTDRGK